MISLHGALYGFGICAVKGTSSDRVIEYKVKQSKLEKIKKELSDDYLDQYGVQLDDDQLEYTAKYYSGKLLGIWDVLERCQDESFMTQFTDSKVLSLTDEHKKSIDKMINYRNDFAHFKPKGFSLLTRSEEWIIKEVVDVIKFLALETGNVFYNGSNNREEVESLINEFNYC